MALPARPDALLVSENLYYRERLWFPLATLALWAVTATGALTSFTRAPAYPLVALFFAVLGVAAVGAIARRIFAVRAARNAFTSASLRLADEFFALPAVLTVADLVLDGDGHKSAYLLLRAPDRQLRLMVTGRDRWLTLDARRDGDQHWARVRPIGESRDAAA